MVLGFAAAGSEGKASTVVPIALPEGVIGLEVGRTGAGDGLGLDDEATQGVTLTFPAPTLFADFGAGIDGKGLAFVAEFQLPFLLTADREDCAVEFFNLRILRPPLPAAEADDPGKTPLGPGSEG